MVTNSYYMIDVGWTVVPGAEKCFKSEGLSLNPQNLCKILAFNVPISYGEMGGRDREFLKIGRTASLMYIVEESQRPFFF